jgi:hypothetical protein
MKHFSLLILAAVLSVATPVPSARAEVDVSIDFFYDALSPHGDWIYADDYGYVFQPTLARETEWAPYSDGYWAYTDAGWTWISNEDFGWATYHYGRWIQMQGSWVWVPGTEWAPAWVSWRQTDDHVGWAPLPPEARWSANVGFNQWTDSYYDVGPSWYNFVPFNLFARRTSLRPVIVNRSRNIIYINRSVNVTNISYRQNVVNNIFVGGPDPDRFNHGDSRIRRLSLRRDEDRFRRDWLDNRGDRPRDFGSLSRIERNELVVASPSVRRDGNPGLPSRVRERFERPEINRGWRGDGDSKAAEALRERQRAELAKAKPAELPERRPFIATSTVPPPAVGRDLKPEERRGSRQRPDPRRVDEEVRRGMPMPNADRPGIPGRPGTQDRPPGPGEVNRPGMTDRDGGRPSGRPGAPDRDGRPGMTDREGGTVIPDRDSRPGMVPGSRRPDPKPGDRSSLLPPGSQPGSRGDSKGERRPGVKPEEAPRPRMAPGVVPNEDTRRPGGGPAPSPTPPRTQNEPPSARPSVPERKMPTPPKSRTELPKVNPGVPAKRPEGAPDVRRPSAGPSARPSARPVPMPEPPRSKLPTNNVRPSQSPRPEAPKARPTPMPSPKVNPSSAPSSKARPSPPKKNESRKEVPSVSVARPSSSPQAKKAAPSARPQVKKSSSAPKPQVKKSAPASRPQVKKSAPAPRPQIKKPAPRPKTQARPSAKKPSPKKSAERKKR